MYNEVRIAAIILLLPVWFPCLEAQSAADNIEPNSTRTGVKPAQSGEVADSPYNTHDLPDSTGNSGSLSPDSSRHTEGELHADLYKEWIDSLEWALAIIVTGVLGSIVYISFKDRKEYDKAVQDAKEAARASNDCEKEARARLASIDKEFGAKLKELEEKGKEQITELLKKADIQQEIISLWNRAGEAHRCQDYETEADIWQKISTEYGLGSRPFFNNWGSALLNLAKQKNKEDPERETLLKKAAEKYEKAESFTKGIAAHNLASIYALLDDESECERWLKIGEEAGRLPSRQRAETDEDLKVYSDKPWFQGIRFKGE